MVGKKNDEVAQKNCRGKLNLIIHNSFSIRAGRRFFCLLILPQKKKKNEAGIPPFACFFRILLCDVERCKFGSFSGSVKDEF